jgi:hypothetical protein
MVRHAAHEPWPVFVTASNVDLKVVTHPAHMSISLIDEMQTLNNIFLHLQDFEMTDPFDDCPWVLMTSTTLPSKARPATIPPIPSFSNEFANYSREDISRFMHAHESEFKKFTPQIDIWVIIDQKGIETSTCVVAQQMSNYDIALAELRKAGSYDDPDVEDINYTDKFRGVRLPYAEAWKAMAYLSVSRAFENLVDDEKGVTGEGLYELRSSTTEEEGAAREEKRNVALKVLRDLGHVE